MITVYSLKKIISRVMIDKNYTEHQEINSEVKGTCCFDSKLNTQKCNILENFCIQILNKHIRINFKLYSSLILS